MAGRPKGLAKTGGRKPGTPNKLTAELKDMILEASRLAGNHTGGDGGTIAYLHQQAMANPVAFMTLLGKVLPMQTPQGSGTIVVTWQDHADE
jgi:hypothetical protein